MLTLSFIFKEPDKSLKVQGRAKVTGRKGYPSEEEIKDIEKVLDKQFCSLNVNDEAKGDDCTTTVDGFDVK